MKIKTDYVTNSSSASFIMVIMSTDKNLDSFQTNLNRYLERYLETYRYAEKLPTLRFYNPRKVEEKRKGMFEITESISMFNTYDDIPHYMRELIIDSKVRPKRLLELFGFKSISFKIIDTG